MYWLGKVLLDIKSVVPFDIVFEVYCLAGSVVGVFVDVVGLLVVDGSGDVMVVGGIMVTPELSSVETNKHNIALAYQLSFLK